MKNWRSLSAASAIVLLALGCRAGVAVREPPWKDGLAQELRVLGHRNWIVVADSAYPAQTSAGIETVYVGGDLLETLRAVLSAIDGSKHVQPVAHLDAELDHVPESLSPGAESFRKELKETLKGRRVDSIPHAEIMQRLDEVGKTFRILLLKTDLAIPYTSVFLELDCGYWGPEKEQKLREAMAAAK